MATVKKPAAKKPAVKKAAAKKPAAKKPAAKKPAVRTVSKVTAAKKPAAKKPAAKAAVKKPAVKAAAKKPAAKTAAKKPAAKAAVKKPATKVASAKAAPAVKTEVKFRDLFDAYMKEKLPREQGYIISSFFSPTSAYSIYEVISYAGVKEIFHTDSGLQFISGGKKLHVLVEPATYPKKHEEPVSRMQGESIPKRYNELEIFTAKNQSKIMVAKDPEEISGSFTILKPNQINFAVVFYELPDMYKTIGEFFEESLNRTRRIPQSDARKVSQFIANTLEKKMTFKSIE
ncbi:MAG: hypothetical protein FWD47_10885 [Treponema sp.]|nr:hypothetical protein [Treponema sp.]